MKNRRKCLKLCLWLGLIMLCFINKDKINIENILCFTPEEPAFAALVMLLLFTLKGLVMVINGNILYMACGLMFSFPLAIAVNLTGTFIMTSIAYLVGKRGGSTLMDGLVSRYRKLDALREFPRQNEFLMTLFIRLFGIFPCEPVGMYLGACGLKYKNYIAGTLTGLMPALLCYMMMGAYLYDPLSSGFSAALTALVAIKVSVIALASLIKKHREFYRTT